MKVGDKVTMSEKNLDNWGKEVCPYAGMTGIVQDLWEDGGFSLNCKTSTLVVPMQGAYGKIKGVWIYLNDEHVYHHRVNVPIVKVVSTTKKKWYQYFLPSFN